MKGIIDSAIACFYGSVIWGTMRIMSKSKSIFMAVLSQTRDHSNTSPTYCLAVYEEQTLK